MRRRAWAAGSIGQTSPPGWSTACAPPAGLPHAACSSAGASGCCAGRPGGGRVSRASRPRHGALRCGAAAHLLAVRARRHAAAHTRKARSAGPTAGIFADRTLAAAGAQSAAAWSRRRALRLGPALQPRACREGHKQDSGARARRATRCEGGGRRAMGMAGGRAPLYGRTRSSVAATILVPVRLACVALSAHSSTRMRPSTCGRAQPRSSERPCCPPPGAGRPCLLPQAGSGRARLPQRASDWLHVLGAVRGAAGLQRRAHAIRCMTHAKVLVLMAHSVPCASGAAPYACSPPTADGCCSAGRPAVQPIQSAVSLGAGRQPGLPARARACTCTPLPSSAAALSARSPHTSTSTLARTRLSTYTWRAKHGARSFL